MTSPEKKSDQTRLAPVAAATDSRLSLGTRVRALRRQAGLSLKELAQRAEVSMGMVSQIERNLANPSVRILERLRAVLNVPLTTLLEGDERAPGQLREPVEFVRRLNDRPHFSVTPGSLAKELLSPHGQHDLQFMIITIPAGSRSREILIGPGEKAGLVLEGDLDVEVNGKVETLYPGDSFQFDSELPHRVDNRGTQDVRVLWIMTTKLPAIHL